MPLPLGLGSDRRRPVLTDATARPQGTQFFTLGPAILNNLSEIFFKYILFFCFCSEIFLFQQRVTDYESKNAHLVNELKSANQRLSE